MPNKRSDTGREEKPLPYKRMPSYGTGGKALENHYFATIDVISNSRNNL